jgi:glycosyltransferase involved in cell wall biosynthesis
LRKLAAEADLAVHCAFIEVEGLSIMEAMQQGVVPVIAEGRYSGTSQFALDRRSIFPARTPEALANRIDYWLSHPKERWETGLQYVQAMKAYDIRQSIAKLTALFERAIREKSSSN